MVRKTKAQLEKELAFVERQKQDMRLKAWALYIEKQFYFIKSEEYRIEDEYRVYGDDYRRDKELEELKTRRAELDDFISFYNKKKMNHTSVYKILEDFSI